MTSNINYVSINENFPVAGQDNDTQVFRDNFDTIKTSLRAAKEEITVLQEDAASLTKDNDFGLRVLQNAIAIGIREKVIDNPVITDNIINIDWDAGSYYVLTLTDDYNIELTKLPGDSSIPGETTAPRSSGRLVLELYTNTEGESRTVNFISVGGTEFKKSEGFPTSVTVDSSSNPVVIEAWRRSTVDGKNYIFLRYLGQFA